MTDEQGSATSTNFDAASSMNNASSVPNQATDVPGVSTDSQGSSDNQSQAPQAAKPVEKMLPQSEVNRLLGIQREHVRQEAYLRAQKEYEAKHQANAQANNGQSNQAQPNASTSMGGMNQPNNADVERIVNDRLEKLRVDAIAQQIEHDFGAKLKAASAKYPDFDSKIADLELNRMPNIVLWANSLDNAGDVMYEFANNPTKLTSVMMLAQSGFPQLAQRELQKLSESIKANESASKQATANQPLDQMSHSPTGGTDSGTMTVKDYRKADWLRV